MIGYGQSTEDCQTSIPNIEHRADWMNKINVKCVQVLRGHRIVEGERSWIIIQQNPKAPQVGRRLDGDFLAVVAHHPRVVAAGEYPGGWVLANPLVSWCRLVSNPHSKPECVKSDTLNLMTDLKYYSTKETLLNAIMCASYKYVPSVLRHTSHRTNQQDSFQAQWSKSV